MKLIFFDESKNAPDYPHYHLGAICLDESALIDVEGAVQAIAIEVFGSAELSSGTEFHASEIFHRKKNFKEWHDFGRRVALLSRLVDVLSRESLSNYKAAGTDFAFGREIKNLVDSVHFTQSHLSRFLQLADVYVWLLRFRNRKSNLPGRETSGSFQDFRAR